MVLLLTGGSGQLGSAIQTAAIERRIPLSSPSHAELDILSPDLNVKISRISPNVVIHCAAQTNWRCCFDDPMRAFALNSVGALNVARACKEMSALMIYVSTDAVFSGTMRDSGFTERDSPGTPVSVYGVTKLAGEQLVSTTCKCLVVRVGWLFVANVTTDKKFVGAILRRARQHGEVCAVTDKWGSPSFAPHVASRIIDYGLQGLTGVRHLANDGVTNRFEFAVHILKHFGFGAIVRPATTNDFPDPVRRPDYAGLATNYPDANLPAWTQAVAELKRSELS
jgi:dTDP-4-dehydrorhamnose reductase